MKKVIASVFIAGVSLTAMAVTLPFEVTSSPEKRRVALGELTSFDLVFGNTPDSISGKTDFAYIHRGPSALSEVKAVANTDMMNWSVGYPDLEIWAPALGNDSLFYIPFDDGLVSEERDGWLRIKGYGSTPVEDGWIDSRKVIQRESLPIDQVNLDGFEEFLKLDCPQDPEGEYMLYAYWNDTYGVVSFMVGKVVDGVLVCPYTTTSYFQESDDEDMQPGFYDTEDGEDVVYVYNLDQGRSLSDFPKETIDLLVNSAVGGNTFNVYLFEDGREFYGDYIIKPLFID